LALNERPGMACHSACGAKDDERALTFDLGTCDSPCRLDGEAAYEPSPRAYVILHFVSPG
jgi:hypothetical protein